MKKSNDMIELEEEEKIAEKDYLGDSLTLPKGISELIEPEQYTIEKDVKLSWDGRQLMARIPLEISDEMEINKNNKGDFRVHFKLVKPAPDSKEEKKVTIQLIKV
ncbi:MAG: hypothetical protein LAKADJCE_00841 [Candidatus Argoarchaeum ethanivorans]|uniref:Uncharacterized protein n=1 Tax=Candidatus Argoarchaeum ethanivorans TaxID=2608793 RepID=A0A811TDS4_9EURY|nr:MAG: hypothetical protein LAKADJCE_00841 [Candidatus Argoarchaeum ethanivorans]